MENFKSSRTKDNLLRAFAGESQARNRYTFAQMQARESRVHVIEEVFRFTADQEKAHAKVFYDFLSEMNGQEIQIDGSYPVNTDKNLLPLLRASVHNEFNEYDPVYPEFAKIAREEGFFNISEAFRLIAAVEKTHGERFEYYAGLIENNQLFESQSETEWMCLNCGHIYTGKEAPKFCPVCGYIQSYFIRRELAPFTK
ncbi:MAG: rubrerythrin family protein [Oscillospiraceae bacterium]|nr:rubrerythrin family protein [Oscillospiraceae bacterium]